MADFKVGDVVKLNSNGPKMTIQKIDTHDSEPSATCRWNYEGQVKEATLPLYMIKIPSKKVLI